MKQQKQVKKVKKAVKAAPEQEDGDDEEESDDSDDDLPLNALKPPSSEQIEAEVKKILSSANLNELSMSALRQKLSEIFKRDMSAQKKLIKVIVNRAMEALATNA